MICEKTIRKYCCEDISLIENYNEAINDPNETWDCHHRLETDLGLSQQELIDTNRYYNVEAKYLIFLTHSEHIILHNKIRGPLLDETKTKISNSHKGKSSWNKGKTGVYSEDTLIKMRKPKSEETKAKMRKPKSEETKRKISEAQRHPQTKYKWETPDGEIIIMSRQSVSHYHKDWKLIGEI